MHLFVAFLDLTIIILGESLCHVTNTSWPHHIYFSVFHKGRVTGHVFYTVSSDCIYSHDQIDRVYNKYFIQNDQPHKTKSWNTDTRLEHVLLSILFCVLVTIFDPELCCLLNHLYTITWSILLSQFLGHVSLCSIHNSTFLSCTINSNFELEIFGSRFALADTK